MPMTIRDTQREIRKSDYKRDLDYKRRKNQAAAAIGGGGTAAGIGLIAGGVPGAKPDFQSVNDIGIDPKKMAASARSGGAEDPEDKALKRPRNTVRAVRDKKIPSRTHAAWKTGKGGILGFREDAHRYHIRELQNKADDVDNWKPEGTEKWLKNYTGGVYEGQINAERKVLRNLKTGKRAANVAAVGGVGAVAYGVKHRNDRVSKKVNDSKERATAATGASVVGASYGAGRVLDSQGEKWADRTRGYLDDAERLVPGTGKYKEFERTNKKGKATGSNIPEIKPTSHTWDAKDAAAKGEPSPLHGNSNEVLNRVGELRGRAMKGAYFANTYGDNAVAVRRIGVPAGIAVAGAGAVGVAYKNKKRRPHRVTKADPIPSDWVRPKHGREGTKAARKVKLVRAGKISVAAGVGAGGYIAHKKMRKS
jgi:hypothetical protein